jgi:hypothetical protein
MHCAQSNVKDFDQGCPNAKYFAFEVCALAPVRVLVFPAKIRTLRKFAFFGMRQPYYE